MITPSLLTEKNYLIEGYTLIGDYLDPFNDKDRYGLYVGHGLFIFQSLQVGVTIEIRNQIVMPIKAVAWLIDAIENKFWQPPSQGGLLKNVHFIETEFDGEKLVIQRCMNAGAEGEMGFSLYNKSREGYISSRHTQHETVSDHLLKEKILPDLKRLNV